MNLRVRRVEAHGELQRAVKRIGRGLDVAGVQVDRRRLSLIAQTHKLAQQGRLPDTARPEDVQDVKRQFGGRERRLKQRLLGRPPDELATAGRDQAIRQMR